ncbi:hypothetical protein J2Z76_002559 [Sedimentibacter acidaminivorans]|uniref:Uncharacterized protein n=1 Tax=Sedimentibacter acidaminivorans TaxID=913099 RepID=A0ABS4GG84_9FIRM|nr:hypothetical protein [Sedimentibacter acidaminivorans]MBP1926689.1 hypothetical protein [Sedimentibacter acidaminivorans]
MTISIAEIADRIGRIGLEMIRGHRITDNFSIFRQIWFSSGKAEV